MAIDQSFLIYINQIVTIYWRLLFLAYCHLVLNSEHHQIEEEVEHNAKHEAAYELFECHTAPIALLEYVKLSL